MSEENKSSIRNLWERTDPEGKIPTEPDASNFTAYIPGSPLMSLEAFQKVLTAYIVEFWNSPGRMGMM
jgi:hypothetical protein